jgi:hypothetical protein
MTSHDICRLNLKSALAAMSHGRRVVTTEITGDCVVCRDHHYWVKVLDTMPLTGTRAPIGGPGHARFIEYEVEACCRWAARTEALDQHAYAFDREGGRNAALDR